LFTRRSFWYVAEGLLRIAKENTLETSSSGSLSNDDDATEVTSQHDEESMWRILSVPTTSSALPLSLETSSSAPPKGELAVVEFELYQAEMSTRR
jgi:hypothetical protein